MYHKKVTKIKMSLFNYLQLQEVEPEDANSPLDFFNHDEITLEDSIDGSQLDQAWVAILRGDDSES